VSHRECVECTFERLAERNELCRLRRDTSWTRCRNWRAYSISNHRISAVECKQPIPPVVVLSGEDGTCVGGAEQPESVPDRMAVSMNEGLASDGVKTSTSKPSVLQPPTHRPRCKRPRRTTRLPLRSRFPPWEPVFASTVRNLMTQHLPHDFSHCIGGCSIVATGLYEPNKCTDVMSRVTTTLGPPIVDVIKHENAFGCGISWAEEKGCAPLQ